MYYRLLVLLVITYTFMMCASVTRAELVARIEPPLCRPL